MAESVNGGDPQQPSKEMSMEVRLLLAFLLMGADGAALEEPFLAGRPAFASLAAGAAGTASGAGCG